MSTNAWTNLAGMALAFLGAAQMYMPQNSPWWAHALVGGATTAIGLPLGYTHSKRVTNAPAARSAK